MSQVRVCKLHRKLPGTGPGYRCFDPRCLAEAGAAASATKLEAVVVPVEREPKVRKVAATGASIPVLAQASKPTSPRGRGVGRRFTKATAVGAASARSTSLAPEQRQAIARRAASVRWGGKAGAR